MATISPSTAILIVAPPTLQRQGLVATLRDARPDVALDTTADLRAVPQRVYRKPPTLVILDATQAGRNLSDLIEEFRATCPQQRMLVLGSRRLPFRIASVIVEMGGGLLLTSRATPADLVAAVERLLGAGDRNHQQGQETAASYVGLSSPENALDLFSARELEVLQLAAADQSNQEIATSLSISIRTVESHRRMLLEKSGYRSMLGLVLHAIRQGWLQLV